MALTYRDEKGSNLTAAEVDANFRELEEAIADFVAPEGRGILSMSVVGDQLYVNLTDATQIGPYTLPTVAYRWRDEWAAGTEYEVYDFFSVAGDGVYLVLQEYTSPEDTTEGPATFDPSVENTEGPLLEKMFGTPSNGPILFAFETGDFTLGALCPYQLRQPRHRFYRPRSQFRNRRGSNHVLPPVWRGADKLCRARYVHHHQHAGDSHLAQAGLHRHARLSRRR
jgi:hypothetical protein